MSRRVKRPLAKSRGPGADRPKRARPPKNPLQRDRAHGDRPRAERSFGDRPKPDRLKSERPQGHRPGGRFPPATRGTRPLPVVEEPAMVAAEAPPLPTKVQTVVVTPDENNMRVDRFLEARFP